MTEGLKLSATLAVEGELLVLRYSVRNGHVRDAYLLDRIYRTSPQWNLSPDNVYVELDRTARLVSLRKEIPPIPPGLKPATIVVPFVTPVRAGGEISETVRVPLPVRTYREYRLSSPDRPEAETKLVHYRQARFALQYYWRIDGTTEETRDLHGTAVVFPKAPQPYRPPQTAYLESPTIALDVPVLEPVAG